MQNTPDAQVISSCYADGIGTIYFDCVNGFTGYKDGKISVEVAYGVWKTNKWGVVVSREFPKDVLFYDNDVPVPPDEFNAHEIVTDVEGNVSTNEYGRCAWVKANLTGKYWSGAAYDIAPTQELKLELPIAAEGVLDNAGSMDNFYRVWVPVQDAKVNPELAQYCRNPMRFRIKRVDRPSANSWRLDDDDLDGTSIAGNNAVKYNALILIDNVIASFPAMKAEAVARGEYAKGLSNRGNVGWIDVLSTRCPAVGEEGLKVRAGLIVSSNTPPEQAINYNADDWVTKATWKYRWRYLDQVTNDWREVTLLPGENGLESTETLKMEDKVGDVEFYYNADLNAPYYGYVDYSGSTKLVGTPGYTERIKSVEARFNPDWLGQEGLPLTLPSLGTDFFFRLREGKSEQLSYKLELRKAGTAEIKECEFYLTGDNTWRALFKTETNETFTGAWQFRVIGANPQNFWGGNEVTAMPVTGQRLYAAAAVDDCWTSFNIDGATGYYMFQLNEDPKSTTEMSYSIVHADYQDFAHWNSAKKDFFVGTYTDNTNKVGAASSAKEYSGELPSWNATSAENDALWTEKFLTGSGSPSAGYDGYPAYYTFPGAYTPNGWEAGQGMWICREYRKGESTKDGEMALQMEGQGRGSLEFNNSSAPHGLESISFNARVAQFGSFREFSYYSGKSIYDLKNYLFTTKVIMAENATTDKFDGSGTVSLLGYYRPNEGGYEVRAERIDNNSIRLSIYKWYYSNGQILSKEVCRSKTSIAFTSGSYLQKSSSNYGEMFVHCKTESDRTIVVGGLINGALAVGSSASGKSHFLVKFEDTAADRYQYGTYGFSSQNCPAQFVNPLYYAGTPSYGSTAWTQNKDTPFKDFVAHYYTKSVTFPGSSTSMFIPHNSTPTYVEWSIDRGKFEKTTVNTTLNAVKAIPTSSPMEVQVKTSGASRWQTIGTTNIVGFGLKEYKFPVYSKDDAAVRLKMGGTIYDVRSDVVIDDVKLRQWRGESYDDAGNVNFPSEKLPQLGAPSNYVYLTGWVNAEGDVRTIDLQPMRARKSDVIAIRAPLMDGYDNRGIGLGMFSFSYENADTNCVLKLQYAKMNGTSYLASYTESVDTNTWTDVAKWDFSKMTDKERASGTLSHYLGMHGVQGVMRLIVDPQVIADSQDAAKNPKNDINYGKITITSFLTRDEPMLDDRSWWGWNLRSSDAPAERIIYDGVPSEANLALVLNNSVADDVPPNGLDPNENTHALYKQHVPFVQSPTFGTNIVGEISFKARKLNPADADAVIAILGARDGKVSVDSEWKVLKSFVVANSFYETFTYKTDPGQDFASFRVAVIGVAGIVDGGNYADALPDGTAPLRVLVDEVTVSEAVRARIGFRNVAAFRSGLEHDFMISNATDKVEQPLCKESWGVQGEVFIAQLEDEVDMERGFDVKLHWFDGMSPWGFENWRTNAAAKSAWLSRAQGTSAQVFRSSYLTSPEAVVPPRMTAGTVQYMLEVQYYTASGAAATNFMSAADWQTPEWYSPIDYNAGRSFSAYNILDTVSPGWAWINEVNVFGTYDNLWVNSDDKRQYVEVAMPAEADLSGWQLRMLDASVQAGTIYTNTLATFGTVNLPGTKPNLKNMASNCVFMVVGCPASPGSLSKSDGELDGIWNFENRWTSAFSSTENVVPIYPVGVQLVRPSGIVEHEILMIGTNFWEGTDNVADMFKPDEYIEFFRERGSRMFYAGAEKGGEENSLGVLNGSGATSNDWSYAMVRTPGRINVGQAINPLHPTPFGSAIMIYSNLGTSGKLSQMIGGEWVKNNEIIILRKGADEGTNLVYRTDMWYEMGSVKVDGASVPWTDMAEPRTYTVNVGAGSSNDMITVDAEAVMQKSLATDFGLTPENRYSKAVLDWLSKGTDIYGNPWADAASGELKLAEYWPWADHDESDRVKLSLTAMYWLDIDPTAGGWVFRAGTTGIHGPVYPSAGVTNIRLSVSMMITNLNSAAAHAPYTLRGLEPGSSSHAYDPLTSDYGWTSVTFKVTGTMLKNLSESAPRQNRVPLRWFVFGENSFGGADGFTSTIDVRDPWASDSPASGYGYQEWLRQNAGKPLPVIGYSWDIDERLKPISADKLKADSTY